jgi:ribonuclease-3
MKEIETSNGKIILFIDEIHTIVGAVYLDKGYDAAANFISSQLLEVIDIDEIVKNKTWLDPKSRFQEKAQEMTGLTPSYKTVKETGPDHNKSFTLGVFIGDVQVALGTGMSKQEAEQKAAEKALEVKGW